MLGEIHVAMKRPSTRSRAVNVLVIAIGSAIDVTSSFAQTPPPATDAPPGSSWISDLEWTLFGRYFHANLSGTLLITKGGKPGSGERINVREDLNLETDHVPEAGFGVSLGDHRLGFDYLPLSFEGKDTLAKPLVFHGTTYPTGTDLSSDLDFTFYSFRYDYSVLRGKLGDFRVGLHGEYWAFDSSIKGSGPGGPYDEHRGFTSFYPGGAFSGQLRHGILHLNGAFVLGGLSTERFLIDTEGSLGVRLWNHLELDMGYRILHFDMTETTNDGDLTAHGPFFQLALAF